MLAIRMRRTGRKGHAQFRVIVQDSRFSPSSGRVVEYLGSYDPHAKTAALDKEKISTYLSNGAQPSDRATRLFKSEGITLPQWVKEAQPKKRDIRHPEKLRRNRPAGEPTPEPAEAAEAPEETPGTTDQVPSTEATPETEPAEQPTPEEPAAGAEESTTESSESSDKETPAAKEDAEDKTDEATEAPDQPAE
jgi:small subunit ribosomal protein S16